jgi:hypothetical protein
MEEKIFFMPGDLVTLKQDLPNKPVMLVVKKETKTMRPQNLQDGVEYFLGIRCR